MSTDYSPPSNVQRFHSRGTMTCLLAGTNYRVHGPVLNTSDTMVTNTARDTGVIFDNRVYGPCSQPVNTAREHG